MIINVQKKPVIVECIQYKNDNIKEILNFSKKAYINRHNEKLYIQTLEGKMLVDDGDYVVKGVEGEFYPVKPKIFKKTYIVRDLIYLETLKKKMIDDSKFIEEVSERIYKESDDLEDSFPEPEWIVTMTELADSYLTRYSELLENLGN